jgi:hypothetical protein
MHRALRHAADLAHQEKLRCHFAHHRSAFPIPLSGDKQSRGRVT